MPGAGLLVLLVLLLVVAPLVKHSFGEAAENGQRLHDGGRGQLV